ncbi:transporter substrate-binding domain-containing protein [Chamaesiphon minutus]|uniref:Periplasmic component of amino acid ABC-type transporter/signal transduction system n=1 Tax=Chamaesiphon minutus (strain ATCC 27169 / PCC 6605) TaxID=1173020 RepID=K9UCA3_CHAP6|nr:transporter substrate-binding domain-containing protein [Chamaesiphon minutus]AFY91824.1 periplasmic component of amino acid ABC-type transporter/signal transduction system [Chamaesiphon minutus PCC 6605]
MKNKRQFNRFKSLFFALLSISIIGNWQMPIQAGTLREIQQRRKLIVAVKDNLPLLGSRDRSGNLQGLEIDIARKLATEIFGNSESIQLVPVANQDRLKVAIDGKVDLTIARVTITPTRSRVVDFSRYYYLDGTAIITDRANIVKNSDLVGKKVAVLNNSTTIASLQFTIPEAKLVGVNNYRQAQSLLATGKVVAIAADRSLLLGWSKTEPKYRLLPNKLSTEALGIVIPKGMQYEPLRELVDRSIERWQADGWLQQRIKYWGL